MTEDHPEVMISAQSGKTSDTFDLTRVKEVVAEILLEFKADHKNLEMTVLKQPFEIVDNTILFILNGEIQKDVFLKIKPEFVGLLRQKLKNTQVRLDLELRENIADDTPKLYTSTDKLNFLKGKSGAFRDLQNRFGLETDF
ncbi:DNA polymerase III subunit gamma/tau [Rhodonellum sp.]|uniref:DNA polymerase III subunit gamma/tau n=1 Tax=Rhodonellum sp. TaxID=2231180 RepID=UPI0027226E31|nr:DNA polymerase III subunit gamma/tau [Rhodonellum sp.]MDO9554626.1 DNA polymerase III subunit gamma/tau [Rhodonellum sp.]